MWGFAAWVGVTLAIYVLATRRVVDVPYSLSHPSVLMNGLIGQNGFLTAAIFTGGVSLLRKRPFVAGIILGSLVIKPQLALLLPVAVIAARLWPAIAGALASAAAFGLVSLALFGTGVFTGFVEILPLYRELMRQDKWPWNEFISVFAFVRYFGIDQSIALTVHFVIAAAAATLTWIAWSRDWEGQVADPGRSHPADPALPADLRRAADDHPDRLLGPAAAAALAGGRSVAALLPADRLLLQPVPGAEHRSPGRNANALRPGGSEVEAARCERG